MELLLITLSLAALAFSILSIALHLRLLKDHTNLHHSVQDLYGGMSFLKTRILTQSKAPEVEVKSKPKPKRGRPRKKTHQLGE